MVCCHLDSVRCESCGTGWNGWYDQRGSWPTSWPTVVTFPGPTELAALRERVDGLHEELQAAHELRRITEGTLEHLSAERDALRSQVRVLELLLHSKSRLWKWLRR